MSITLLLMAGAAACWCVALQQVLATAAPAAPKPMPHDLHTASRGRSASAFF
jgi:hypothetical protein